MFEWALDGRFLIQRTETGCPALPTTCYPRIGALPDLCCSCVCVIVVGWIAVGGGAATVIAGVGYICLDAFSTPGAAAPTGSSRVGGALADRLRGWSICLPALAAAALIASGVFAWLQPGAPPGRSADMPGMTAVIGWTALAIAVPVAVALVSTLLGLPN